MKHFAIISWILILLFVACGTNNSPTVKILSGQNGTLIKKFKVEIADDSAERTMGLMFREELGSDRGMLFIWPEEVQSSFWMKNTLIPLDIIFIGSDKKIINIVEHAEPQTTTPRMPAGPFLYVLEIEGGRSADLGIKAGDQAEF